MKSFDIVTIGGAMRDIFFSTKEGKVVSNEKDPLCRHMIAFELGAKVYVDTVHFGSGGGANNTANGFSILGLKTALIARVGNDREGDALLNAAQKNGVDTSLIEIDNEVSTGFALILTIKGFKRAQTIFAYRGTSDILKMPNLNFKTKWVYISSLSCPNWPNILDRIFKLKKSGVQFAWNPANVQLKVGAKELSPWLKQLDVLIFNEDEARELVLSHQKVKDFSVRNLIKIVHQMGPKIVVITVGQKGAYAYDGDKFYFQKPWTSRVINITGAGDSFSSGFMASLFYKPKDIRQALIWGVRNSASVIHRFGAQNGLLTKSQITSSKK
ncbi:MAG: carbohydrate kinase family protein [Bacteroidales bacterium]|nr:carbohydrate kinase family protein [Bacteroidales bacterium]